MGIQGLFLGALPVQFPHLCADRFRNPRGQLKNNFRDRHSDLRNGGSPVAKGQLLPVQSEELPAGKHARYRGNHLCHLSSVGSGVGLGPASDRSGNAGGKFQPRQSPIRRLGRDGRHHGARLGPKNVPFRPNPVHAAAHSDDKSSYPTVEHQQVASMTDHRNRKPVFFCLAEKPGHILGRSGKRQPVHGASQLQGGIVPHLRSGDDLVSFKQNPPSSFPFQGPAFRPRDRTPMALFAPFPAFADRSVPGHSFS